MGCRTTRDDPIPSVDTRASLAVLNTYSPQQLQTAEEFTAAVGACQDFACLRRANELVRAAAWLAHGSGCRARMEAQAAWRAADAAAWCRSLRLPRAALQPRAPGQFRFPHFFVIGFQKCATTSVYCHLITHPQVQYPLLKVGGSRRCPLDLACLHACLARLAQLPLRLQVIIAPLHCPAGAAHAEGQVQPAGHAVLPGSAARIRGGCERLWRRSACGACCVDGRRQQLVHSPRADVRASCFCCRSSTCGRRRSPNSQKRALRAARTMQP